MIEDIVGRYMHVEIAGVPHRIYYEEAGRGIPLLCLHTAGSDTRQYRGLLTDGEVTERFRCISFDLPWHGKSSPPSGWWREDPHGAGGRGGAGGGVRLLPRRTGGPALAPGQAVVFIWPYGILVNRLAERFVDESSGTADATYDNVTRTIADQPDGIAWVVFDAQVDDIPQWRRSIRSEVPPIEAATIEALAEACGLSPASLRATVDAHNAACPAASSAFTPLRLDGVATTGLVPPRSNWARPILRAPFRAFPIICTTCFTFGGLKVNTDAQVLDCDGRVMPGLYAAGETVGIYHQVYVGSTSVMRGAVFGRLAGLHAAQMLQGRRAAE